MGDLQALHEALQQREQELAAAVTSQAVSQQQEEDLKQVAAGSDLRHRYAAEHTQSGHCRAYHQELLAWIFCSVGQRCINAWPEKHCKMLNAM